MNITRILLLVSIFFITETAFSKTRNEPDSVYLFSYATAKNNNHNGLHFAWSRDRETWVSIGNEYSFLKSDYGRWGSEKRMIAPYLIAGADGQWHMIWSLNAKDNVLAYTSSADLISWIPQRYPALNPGTTFGDPMVKYDAKAKNYSISYKSNDQKYYRITTKDFKTYTAAAEIPTAQYSNPSLTIDLPAGKATGQVYRVAWAVVEKLISTYQVSQYRGALYSESTKQDAERFKELKPLTATLTLQPQKAKPISDLLLGVFFEDLNYAADGGLYAELIQNRDFEYRPSDKEGRDKTWNSTHSWALKGSNATFTIDSMAPISASNPHYAVLNVTTPGAALTNTGFDGVTVKKGQAYDLSLFGKQLAGKGGKVQISLVGKDQALLAQTTLTLPSTGWKKLNAVLLPNADSEQATLEVKPLSAGSIALDMVSLFPKATYKNHKNGLRADLAKTIADIHPRFVRFPGGCVAHGDGLANIYNWKNTIGSLENRVPQRNLWGYHQSAGLGYFEYFQFCEDIGAEPVPVVAAGVPCQNSGTGGAGQQGGLPMDQMDEYIQDVIDLVEYANGAVSTPWGKKRAEAGHPKPFNLKYVGIGNEDLISEVFEERFAMIYKAMRKAHPEITVIGTVGPYSEGADYKRGWEIANELKVPMVDEHYYQSPGWFIHNQDYYDSYDRSRSKIYLGEYAAHLPGKPSNLEVALTEALYLTSLERNGDVLSMASYAPLLAKEKHTQWTPDLIYFNNTEVKPTVSYYVQQLYGQNAGNRYVPSTLTLSDQRDAVTKRVATSIVFDTQNNYMVIKIVNLLPVAVRSTLDLQGINIADAKAIKTVLQGAPGDKMAKPVESVFDMNNKPEIELPGYSFTVLKVKIK